ARSPPFCVSASTLLASPHALSFSSSTFRPPPRSTLFPYTTLFRSRTADLLCRRGSEHQRTELYRHGRAFSVTADGFRLHSGILRDRKSTRLNSSHVSISYAVFCLKKKTTTRREPPCASVAPRPKLS